MVRRIDVTKGFCNRCGLYERLSRDRHDKNLRVCDTCNDVYVDEVIDVLVDEILIPDFQADHSEQ